MKTQERGTDLSSEKEPISRQRIRGNRSVPFSILFFFLTLLQWPGSSVADNSSWQELEALFARAVSAERVAYYQLREEILSREEAMPFLRAKLASNDVYSRVLAQAMLARATSPPSDQMRVKLLFEATAKAVLKVKRGTPLDNVRGDTYGHYDYGNRRYVQPSDALHEIEAVPFLLEVVLKGPPDRDTSVDMTQPFAGQEAWVWQSCFAAGLVGVYTGEDGFLILKEVLNSDKVAPLRASAAEGIRKKRTVESIELLIKALSDKSPEVRESALYGVEDLTEQKFGPDAARYSAWWKQNKERFLKDGVPKPHR